MIRVKQHYIWRKVFLDDELVARYCPTQDLILVRWLTESEEAAVRKYIRETEDREIQFVPPAPGIPMSRVRPDADYLAVQTARAISGNQ